MENMEKEQRSKFNKTLVTYLRIAFILALTTVLGSCVSIPKETAEMSVLLEQQLYALKKANNSIIESAYKEKEKNITDYIDNVWYPRFLDNYFKNPVIENLWNEVIQTDSLENRMEMLQMLTSSCMKEYKKYKESLLNDLEVQKDTTIKAFNYEYDLAIRMNDVIQKNVSSASALQSEYKKHLDKIISTERLDSLTEVTIEKIDNSFEKIIEGLDKYDEIKDKIEKKNKPNK